MENRLDMQEGYTKYYKKLLKTMELDNESERIIEEEVNKNNKKNKSNRKYH